MNNTHKKKKYVEPLPFEGGVTGRDLMGVQKVFSLFACCWRCNCVQVRGDGSAFFLQHGVQAPRFRTMSRKTISITRPSTQPPTALPRHTRHGNNCHPSTSRSKPAGYR